MACSYLQDVLWKLGRCAGESGVLWLIARDSCLFWKPAVWSCLLTASQRASVCTGISLRLGRGLFWAWVFAMSLPNLICSLLETPVNSVSVCHNQCLFFSLASQASALASSEPVPGSSWLWEMLSLSKQCNLYKWVTFCFITESSLSQFHMGLFFIGIWEMVVEDLPFFVF